MYVSGPCWPSEGIDIHGIFMQFSVPDGRASERCIDCIACAHTTLARHFYFRKMDRRTDVIDFFSIEGYVLLYLVCTLHHILDVVVK